MLKRRNVFHWAQWEDLGRRKVDTARDREGQEGQRGWVGGPGGKSPPDDIKTDEHVRNDREVSKVFCLWLMQVETELRPERTALSGEACSV